MPPWQARGSHTSSSVGATLKSPPRTIASSGEAASANQRAGRCGRVGAGIAIRLYSEEDFLSRPEFTEPEIQRTNLAAVILQMHALKLGDIEAFPFVEPPDGRFVRDGLRTLRELGALSSEQRACVALCLAAEFSHAKAAEALGLPLGTVKSHVARGRAKLLDVLGGSHERS